MQHPPSPQPPAAHADDAALLDEAADRLSTLARRVEERIVGQPSAVRALLAAALAEGHVLIVGVPGLAKTLLVRTLAQGLGCDFGRIQFTPDMMPSDVIGAELLEEDPATRRRSMRFVPGPVFTHLLLADEINRTPPRTQAALLEAMQERAVTSLGATRPIEPPFLVFATQNPIEQEGTYPLPEAQLDRFMLSLYLDYPSETDERRIVASTVGQAPAPIEPTLDRDALLRYQALLRRAPTSAHVVDYAVAITRATRPTPDNNDGFIHQHVRFGAGPRAAQHLVLLAKALAVLDGRPTPGADHVREAAGPVLRHRLLPSYHALGQGVDAAQIATHAIDQTPEPHDQHAL